MAQLSVNINKLATLRNARGGNLPNLEKSVTDIQNFGAQGITIHPRPDERHIKYADARQLAPLVHTEYNIEGNPITKFVDLVLEVRPTQVTLVPDAEDAITSNAGWDTNKHQGFLSEVISEFKGQGIRTSIFLDPNVELVEAAAKTGADRIELYTEDFAKAYAKKDLDCIKAYADTANEAQKVGLGINAGHDLNLDNIKFFSENVPGLLEVSIGHALICESIYLGLENVINMYLHRLRK